MATARRRSAPRWSGGSTATPRLQRQTGPLVPADTLLENAVRICVACDYEVATAPGKARRFRIVRSASESIRDGEWRRSPTRVELVTLLPPGPVPIENPESLISTHFPASRRRTLFLNDTRCAAFTEPGTQAVEAAFQAFGLDKSALARVSDGMNALFLDMIGEYTSDIGTSRASITTDFRLVMSESDGSSRLAYERLGGSARHALALALLFALADVSGVETFGVPSMRRSHAWILSPDGLHCVRRGNATGNSCLPCRTTRSTGARTCSIGAWADATGSRYATTFVA